MEPKIKPTDIPCPICQSIVPCYKVSDFDMEYFKCPICGQYGWCNEDYHNPLNKNQLLTYLAYHAIAPKDDEGRYYTTLAKELCSISQISIATIKNKAKS
jgi:hypothetical protein